MQRSLDSLLVRSQIRDVCHQQFSLCFLIFFKFFSHQIFSKYSVVLVRKFRGLHSLKPCFFLANVWHNVEYAQVCQRLQCGNGSLASQNVSHGHFCSHSCSAIIRASNQNIYLFYSFIFALLLFQLKIIHSKSVQPK